ncbi:MAG: hypothetical protein LBM74_00825 [Oscillospiraceae bacterium]|nr:hypothetical protein [Oscillospiraceae bacterium]
MITGREELKRAVRAAVRAAPAVDLGTRLTLRAVFTAPAQGVDALLTTPALLKEAVRYGDDPRLAAPELSARADAVFERLFLQRSPVSFQAQAALWSLKRLGLEAGARDLGALRAAWATRSPDAHLLDALDMAGLSQVAVRADLFAENVQPLSFFDERLSLSLCLDALPDAETAWPRLIAAGCHTEEAVRIWLSETARRLEAGSFCLTRPPQGRLLTECALPVAKALGLPLVVDAPEDGQPPEPPALLARIRREGFAFRPYVSAAATPEALPGLWELARRALAEALCEAYLPLVKAGWQLEAGEIENDVAQWMGAK